MSVKGAQDDILIRQVVKADEPAVLDLLHRYFFPDEPLTGTTEPVGVVQKAEEEFVLSNIQHNSCYIAIHKPSNKAVGVCMAGPQGTDEADALFAAAAKEGDTKWGKILKFLGAIERDAQVAKRYKVQKIMYVIATCVDSAMRGKQLGARLYNAVHDMARARGYELLRSDCTSYYSARIKDQLNWDLIHTVNYKDYVDENNRPVFSPPPPHTCCKSYAIRL